jgi:hypothetical protein
MTRDLDQTPFPSDPVPLSDQPAAEPSSPHGTVEPCEFEELLERAMEILKARSVGAGSRS